MQVTIINKVKAQVIHGPANHTYVNPISPYIKYNWDISLPNNNNYTVVYGATSPGAQNEWANISWNWANLPANPEIKIIEEPIYPLLVADPLYPYLPVDPLGEVTLGPPAGAGLSDNAMIQGAINAMKAHIDITGMTGTVRFPTPPAGVVSYTYLIEEILLAHGVRLVGSGQGATILQRFIAAPPANPAYRKMLNTNYAPNNWTNWYTFLPKIDNLNSKPIEISGMTIDGVVTIDVNNPTPNAWEQSALIWLEVPHEKVAASGIYVQELNENLHGYCGAATDPNGSPPNNAPNNACYQSQGSGKLKVFIHDVEFKNSRSDAVSQLENVDLNMHHCTGHDIYRGTYTLTGGAAKARLKDISTSTTAGILTKAVDLEGDQLGYGGIRKFRLWMDNCQFDKNVQLDFRCSNVLMTNTVIEHYPTTIIGYSHGDLVTNNCTLSFAASYGGVPNYMLAPHHAKFNNTIFNFEQGVFQVGMQPWGCFNGIYYQNHVQGVYHGDAHIGFNACSFTNNSNPLIGMPPSYTPRHGIYIYDHNNLIYSQNNPEKLKLYFDNCTNSGMDLPFAALYNSYPVPNFPNGLTFNTDVLHMNQIYTGGESEDEMKTHFGIRKLDLDEFPCNPSLVNNSNIDKWDNPKASEIIAHYNTNNNNGSVIKNKEIYINGTFTVDVNIKFEDNCIIWFTQTGKVKLVGPYTFTVDESILQAACDYWLGIKADDPQQKVTIQNDSYIKKAGIGLHASNGAVIEVTDSHFEDNYQYGIYVSNTAGPYTGIINHNTFTMQANLPANPFPPIKAGIHLYDVAQLNIGDIGNANTGNHFEGLYTGIWVTNHDFNSASNIGIYNCSFKNINNTALTGNYIESQKINNCYNSAKGAAVFANYTGLPNLLTRLIDVRNTAAANASLKFENCDKGIVSVALPVKAKNLYLKDCLMGCNNINTDGKVYDVQDNTLENIFLGMQFIGDNANSIVKGNTISSPTAISAVQTAPQNYIWPVAIDVRNMNNNTANQFVIKENIITMKDYAGLGINMLNTGKEANAFKNTIGLTTTNQGVIVCAGATLLNGIYATNAYKTKMEGNHVNGNANLLIPAREDISGIYLNKSTYNELHCNFVNNTRFGIMAQANCHTNPDAVKGNSLFNHVLGWVFRKLGPEGTFGDVGTQNFDNNNLFAGNNYVFRVFKFCEGGLPDQILTNPNTLTSIQSNSEDINNQAANTCPYLIGQNQIPFTTYMCPVNLNAVPNNTATTIDLPNAIAIATNTKTYSAFPEISQWIDMRMLFKILESDSVFKNSNDTLLNFYDSLQNVDIANIENAESSMNTLIESMESQNYALYLQRIAEAEQSNSNIISQTVQEANEQDINTIYLKILHYGLDTLTDEDSIRIEELAMQCPYIGGTAVYKARALYAMYAPASMFDDIKICNAVGVYKNGSGNDEDKKGIFDSENNYLRNIKARTASAEIAANEILLYPNPSESQLNIRYNFDKDSKLQIVDMLGIIVKEVFLSKDTKQVSLFVNDLAPGVYSYRQIYDNTTINTGKLIISK